MFLKDLKLLTYLYISVIDSGRYFMNQTSENIQLGSALWTYWSLAEKNKKDFVNVAMFIK